MSTLTLEQGLQALWNLFYGTSVVLAVFGLLVCLAVIGYLAVEHALGRYRLWKGRDPFTKDLIARRKAER